MCLLLVTEFGTVGGGCKDNTVYRSSIGPRNSNRIFKETDRQAQRQSDNPIKQTENLTESKKVEHFCSKLYC